jgi:hypothetical protein
MYVQNLKFSDNFCFKFATEIFRFIATSICSSAYETHQGRKPQAKQEAGLEAWLLTLMLRQF